MLQNVKFPLLNDGLKSTSGIFLNQYEACWKAQGLLNLHFFSFFLLSIAARAGALRNSMCQLLCAISVREVNQSTRGKTPRSTGKINEGNSTHMAYHTRLDFTGEKVHPCLSISSVTSTSDACERVDRLEMFT